MSIYVDRLQQTNAPWLGGRSCHLQTDGTVEELHAFAAQIGCKRAWFQPNGGGCVPHYDLAPALRQKALKAGALECGQYETVEIIRLWRSRKTRNR